MGNTASLSRTSSHSRTSKSSLKSTARRLTKNERLLQEKFIDAFDRRDKQKHFSLGAPGSTFSYKGAEACMPFIDLQAGAIDWWDSFPDIRLFYDSLEEIRPGIVVIRGFYARGTHTGKPYGFGPFPPIPATGIEVTEDPCNITFKIKNGKVLTMECDAINSDMNGPLGWYVKIGGKLDQSIIETQ